MSWLAENYAEVIWVLILIGWTVALVIKGHSWVTRCQETPPPQRVRSVLVNETPVPFEYNEATGGIKLLIVPTPSDVVRVVYEDPR